MVLKAQPAAAQEPKNAAMKLPDGTIVIYTTNPNDAVPAADAVVLSAKDYQKLVDAAKAKKVVTPETPGVCKLTIKLPANTTPSAAVIEATYQFRTTTPDAVVALGGAKAFATAATLDGRTPVLEATAAGLTLRVPEAGEHTAVVTFQSGVQMLPTGAMSAEIGLPRAAITTVRLVDSQQAKTVKATVQLGAELETTKLVADRDSTPLGPAESLSLNWIDTTTVQKPTDASLELNVAVLAEESRVETHYAVVLRGPQSEWTLVMPAGLTLTTESSGVTVKAISNTECKVILPKGTYEAVLGGVQIANRPAVKMPTAHAIAVVAARGHVRAGGVIRMHAPASLRVVPKANADVRRVDVPLGDGAPVAQFRFVNLLKLDERKTPLLEFDLRTATGVVTVQPRHALTLAPAGWRLHTVYRVMPVRTAVEQFTIELPAGWREPTFGPLDAIDEVTGGSEAITVRTFIVRLASPQREAFEMTLDARFPIEAGKLESMLPWPRVTSARERDVQVNVTVPDSHDITGQVHEWDAGKIAAEASEFDTIKPGALQGTFDSVATLQLAWPAAKPRFAAMIDAEIAFSDRQAVIHEHIEFDFGTSTPPAVVEFNGPANAAGFRSTPLLEPSEAGAWTWSPGRASKGVVTLSYALPFSRDTPAAAVPLVRPEAARVTTRLRVTGSVTGKALAGFEGAWREVPPGPVADRDAWPWLTLESTGTESPLKLRWADADTAGSVIAERCAQEWSLAGPDSQARARWKLIRWPGTLKLTLPQGEGVQIFINLQRVEHQSRRDDGGLHCFVNLPEMRAVRSSLVLEVRFRNVTEPTAPRIEGLILQERTLWQVTTTEPHVLLTLGDFEPIWNWSWRTVPNIASGTVTEAQLEQWLADGRADALVSIGTNAAGLCTASRLRVIQVSHLGMMSMGAFVAAVGMLIARRMSSNRRIAAMTLLAFSLFCAALLRPQPVVTAVAAALPGLIGVLGLWAGMLIVRGVLHRRATRLATFQRGRAPVAFRDSSPGSRVRAASTPVPSPG